MTLALAMVLDAIFGEPRLLWSRVPHPAVLMGRLIAWLDKRFNTGERRRQKGVICLVSLCLGGGLLGIVVPLLPGGMFLELLLVAILLAQRSLVDHVKAVADGLRISLGDGKRSVAMIVGRDTSSMDQPAVARAAIESAAENFSDGVLAPVFWYLIAGLPGLIVYKLTNTADSMIGYRTPRHEAFGWASARFDDLLNLVPARLTAMLFAGLFRQFGAWRDIASDAGQHRSPNAGWPEAAMARAIGVALSGPRSYEGDLRDYAYVNAIGRKDAGPRDVDASARVLWAAWAVLLLMAIWLGLLH